MTNDFEAFSKELVELCLKHGFEIGGCGCCGSPWITPANDYSDFYAVPTVSWPKEVEEVKDNFATYGQATIPEFTFDAKNTADAGSFKIQGSRGSVGTSSHGDRGEASGD